MKISKKELTELHNVELNILKEFIKVCQKLNLRYYLVGGTAIGCVRHQGFIPWDDDIDVAMPRKDYEIFLAKAQKLLPKYLFVQTIKTEKNYYNLFAKIRNSNTTFIEENDTNLNINKGIFIDVFPLDGMGNTEKQAIKNLHKFFKLKEIYNFKNQKLKTKGIRNKIRYFYYFLLSLQYINCNMLEIANKFSQKLDFDSCKYVGSFCGAYGNREIQKLAYFGKGKLAKFEDIEANIPIDSDAYLHNMYGNYMELPPKDKRVAPHCYYLNTRKSYLEYLKKDC